MREFHCCGTEEYVLNESEIDDLLGERSYCGGELPLDVLDTLDQFSTRQPKATFYFEQDENVQKFNSFLADNGLVALVQSFESQDWNAEWKKHFSRIEISKKLAVYPDWDEAFNHETIVRIQPGMGFGTGSHETTFLCLQLLEKYSLYQHDRSYDFGCGSGILGIAHALLNPSFDHIALFDIDQDALGNCRYNLKLNSLNDEKFIVTNEFSSFKKYNLVFANILLSTLKEQKENILSICSPGTDIIFSGLLNNQEAEFLDFYSDFSLVEVFRKGDWVAIYMKKK
jgi:ribosomal protein L11 methyltransferase